MKQKISVLSALLMVLAAVLITFSITLTFAWSSDLGSSAASSDSTSASQTTAPETYFNGEKLEDIIQKFESISVNGIDRDRITDDLLKGFVAGTGDKYAEYMTAEEYEAFIASYQGSFVGIGVTVQYDEDANAIRIVDVTPDSPADEAGFAFGDFILAVNGEDVDYDALGADSLDRVANMIRGKEGTEVRVTVERDGEAITLSAIRRWVESRSVRYQLDEINGKKVAYIAITSFDYPTAGQFKEAIDSAEKDGADYIIYDLRNNGGGLLVAVTAMLTYILPPDELLCTVEYVDEMTEVRSGDEVSSSLGEANPSVPFLYSNGNSISYNQAYADHTVTLKSAVLINGSTASAAELFTSTLRDHGLVITAGENSYGKGCMQVTYSFADGTALKLTSAFYNPPCGINYDKTTDGPVGIAPDEEVIFNDEEKKNNLYLMPHDKDRQYVAAFNAITDGEPCPIPPAEKVT